MSGLNFENKTHQLRLGFCQTKFLLPGLHKLNLCVGTACQPQIVPDIRADNILAQIWRKHIESSASTHNGLFTQNISFKYICYFHYEYITSFGQICCFHKMCLGPRTLWRSTLLKLFVCIHKHIFNLFLAEVIADCKLEYSGCVSLYILRCQGQC